MTQLRTYRRSARPLQFRGGLAGQLAQRVSERGGARDDLEQVPSHRLRRLTGVRERLQEPGCLGCLPTSACSRRVRLVHAHAHVAQPVEGLGAAARGQHPFGRPGDGLPLLRGHAGQQAAGDPHDVPAQALAGPDGRGAGQAAATASA